MKKEFIFYLTSIKILILTILLFDGITLIGKPTVKEFNLRIGTSSELNSYSYAKLYCNLINPDKKTQNIEVRLASKSKGLYNQKNVFSEIVTVPPKTSIKYYSTVMLEDSEQYILEIFHKGKKIGKTSPALIVPVSIKSRPVAIFNDSDINFGAFSGMPEFRKTLNPCFFFKDTSVGQWNLLELAPYIIFVKPDFSEFSTRKFQAVIDYVKQGGILIFSHPDALKEAVGTPLEPMLPIKPLRTRQVTRLPELSKILPGFKEFTKPVPFVESISSGNGITILESGDFPIIRYKKYGLGIVKAAAVPLNRDSYKNNEWKSLLKLFLADNRMYNDTDPVKQTLDEMTGFAVPEIESVRWIILSYLLLLGIPVGLGLYLRKTGLFWIAAGGLAIIFTLSVLYFATSKSNDENKEFLSFIELMVPGGNSISGDGFYGIMSSSDKTVNIKPETESIIMNAIPPPETKIISSAMSKGYTPTEIKNINGSRQISGLNLPINSPRHFTASYTKPIYDEPKIKLPRLIITDKMLFEKWKLPKGINAEAAWVQFPSGEINLQIQDRFVSQASKNTIFDSNTILKSVKTFLKKGWRHRNPMLVIVENSDKSQFFDIKNTVAHGKRITILPVNEVYETDKIRVPSETILLLPGNTSTQRIMNGNEINNSIYSRVDESYLFQFQIPPNLTLIKPEKIKVDFSYVNDSNNVSVEPFLLGKEKRPDKKREKSRNRKNKKNQRSISSNHNDFQITNHEIILGKSDRKNEYIFDNIKEDFISNSGTALIGLKVKIKNHNMLPAAKKKANTWSVKKLDIHLSGKINMTEEKIIY